MREIKLTRDYVAIVDDEDYEALMKNSWYADVRKNQVYAARKCGPVKRQQKVYLHQQVLNFPGQIIDHINGNSLDNQKANLRICDRSINAANAKKRCDGKLSQYKGVTYDKAREKWVAQITVRGKHTYLGRFSTEKEAAVAYNGASKVLFNQAGRLNDV